MNLHTFEFSMKILFFSEKSGEEIAGNSKFISKTQIPAQ